MSGAKRKRAKRIRESLPWFPFYYEAYLTDTMALNTEGHGAYLLLILHYYSRRRPPNDSDIALAAIARMPLERWLQHRPEIATFFQIGDGVWRHERVERELAEQEARREQARKARAAYLGDNSDPPRELSQKTLPKQAGSTGAPTPAPTPVGATSADGNSCPHSGPHSAPHSDPHSVTLQEQEQVEEGSANALPRVGESVSTIPEAFRLTGSMQIACQCEGYDAFAIEQVFRSFHRYHWQKGTFSDDWAAAWERWWNKNKPALHPSEKPKKRQAPPRVEVSTRTKKAKTAIPEGWAPNQNNAETAREEGYNLADIERHFRDVCEANGYTYANHHAAFNNFIRNQKNFRKGTNAQAPRRGSSIVDAGDRLLNELDRRIEAAESADGGGQPAVQVLSEV